ncbi:MAG: hypothetical protein JST04_03195 [Bdellovibrionales bacterium]|nr:hypothetical protein [Bdellovibrionales bacterium]
MAESRSIETVAAISTLDDATEESFLEKALSLMLHQAERDGTRTGAARVENPFFRLSPKERFALFLLHSGRVSYRRLARLIGATPEEVQTIAWSARSQIASSPEVRLQAPHPTGSSRLKSACPEFNPAAPWTQKLLDDEMGSAELSFLQNHTAVCEDCRRALARTREFYYAVEKWVPVATGAETDAIGNSLRRAVRKGRLQSGNLPADLTLFEALGLFFSRRENLVWFLLAALAFVALLYAQRTIGPAN